MTESEHQEIVDFTANLSTQRQQISDRDLLDKCQVYLAQLLELSKDVGLEADPVKEEQASQ